LSRKCFTALVATASILAGCTAPPATTSTPHPSARLGTVPPAYPVGASLEPGVVLEAIPVAELSTTEPVPFYGTDLCASVPGQVVSPANVTATPVYSSEFGCVWHGSDMGLEIGAAPDSMAKEVEAHLAMANGRSTDRLAHLAWLRVDGHYAIERILKFDRTKGCWLTLDVSSPATMHVVVYRIDPATGEPAESDTDTSVSEICPVTRQIASNLLDHIDDEQPGWWETFVQPTG
jgi:hypothetical protein